MILQVMVLNAPKITKASKIASPTMSPRRSRWSIRQGCKGPKKISLMKSCPDFQAIAPWYSSQLVILDLRSSQIINQSPPATPNRKFRSSHEIFATQIAAETLILERHASPLVFQGQCALFKSRAILMNLPVPPKLQTLLWMIVQRCTGHDTVIEHNKPFISFRVGATETNVKGLAAGQAKQIVRPAADHAAVLVSKREAGCPRTESTGLHSFNTENAFHLVKKSSGRHLEHFGSLAAPKWSVVRAVER